MFSLLALLLGKLDMRWNMGLGWGLVLALEYFQSCEFFPASVLLVYFTVFVPSLRCAFALLDVVLIGYQGFLFICSH